MRGPVLPEAVTVYGAADQNELDVQGRTGNDEGSKVIVVAGMVVTRQRPFTAGGVPKTMMAVDGDWHDKGALPRFL